ncbi:MAG: flagellar basal body-associated FliL family protein [Pseudomonadales bacterium]|nr:flagellar basal body-associated FliL family protein [Pseudomonadales bacterium]MCP5215363.1 flagellar basal body-associated FliL family protein [Pseudomonadales bacterium]
MAVKGKQKGKAKEEEVLEVEDESKKSSNKRIIIIAAVLLGIGVSAIAGYFFIGGDKETTTEVAGIENKKVQSIYFRLEKPFVVNIQSSGRQRHMQVDVTIKGKDQHAMDTLKKHEPVVKNDLNQLFGSQQIQVLQTQEGLLKMNEDATKTVQSFLQKEIGSPGIEQVLFTNFVMQ